MTGAEFQHIRATEHDGVTLIEFNVEDLVDEETVHEAGEEVLRVIEAPECRKLVVSFRGVRMLSSSALGKLITVHRRVHRKEGKLLFCDLSETVLDVLHACRLDSFFILIGDRQEALKALA
jgi:anti-sigma B factor antagonist